MANFVRKRGFDDQTVYEVRKRGFVQENFFERILEAYLFGFLTVGKFVEISFLWDLIGYPANKKQKKIVEYLQFLNLDTEREDVQNHNRLLYKKGNLAYL